MDMRTRLISVERDELDPDCVLVNLRVDLGILDDSDASTIALCNRMAGETMFSWLAERVPRSVFEGFMDAVRRNGFAE